MTLRAAIVTFSDRSVVDNASRSACSTSTSACILQVYELSLDVLRSPGPSIQRQHSHLLHSGLRHIEVQAPQGRWLPYTLPTEAPSLPGHCALKDLRLPLKAAWPPETKPQMQL